MSRKCKACQIERIITLNEKVYKEHEKGLTKADTVARMTADWNNYHLRKELAELKHNCKKLKEAT